MATVWCIMMRLLTLISIISFHRSWNIISRHVAIPHCTYLAQYRNFLAKRCTNRRTRQRRAWFHSSGTLKLTEPETLAAGWEKSSHPIVSVFEMRGNIQICRRWDWQRAPQLTGGSRIRTLPSSIPKYALSAMPTNRPVSTTPEEEHSVSVGHFSTTNLHLRW